MTDLSYVVVTLSVSPCDVDPTSRCVMGVDGPFATAEEAGAFVATLADWTNPHVMPLMLPGNYARPDHA